MVSLGIDSKFVIMSNEMCDFLSLPHGSEINYFEMGMNVLNYCSIHNLFVGTRIKTTDVSLNTLLGIDHSFDLNLLTIHSLLEKHILQESELKG